MVANKSEQTVKDEILNLVKEYCNIYHCQKREFYEGGWRSKDLSTSGK